ncbi:MAG: aminotransferase class III-fold pyridoxal phosphate-dependent enzyme [Planctomycetaceae bacterium]|nr:aminotransferase class III-fold pyridoxal phosphate-dependent enzyme [Planctomycetaceae bacterium]
MTAPIQFPGETRSNAAREAVARTEPLALRTFTPSQAVFAKSSGVFHFTPEGRRLFDFSSGVLVANLGHNPRRWLQRFAKYAGWTPEMLFGTPETSPDTYCDAVTLTAYNGVTLTETLAVSRLLKSLRTTPFGQRLDTIIWAASGSEGVHKAIYSSLARDRTRDMVLATRYGFHGKKGWANAVTGSETDAERDPRVRFISFPMYEIADHSQDGEQIALERYEQELAALWSEFGPRINCLITEPYLGGGGSFHPPAKYHHLLERFCREHDILFLFDEVQANFGRTGKLFAFEKYGVEPDMVILGKGLGNGVPVAAVACNSAVTAHMKYGEASDTWSANPLSSAAVLATLDEFEAQNLLPHIAELTPVFFTGLDRLKQTGLVTHVRGEGVVFGLECAAVGDVPANEVAVKIVEKCYLGADNVGIHLLGALSGKVLRVSPPLTITVAQAKESLDLMSRLLDQLAGELRGTKRVAAAVR